MGAAQCSACQKVEHAKSFESQTLVERHKRIINYDQQQYTDLYETPVLLHKGRVSQVHRAKRRGQQVWRAVKTVPKAEVDYAHWAASVEVLQQCDHPHVIRLYETFQDDNVLCQIAELCLGGNLTSISSAEASLMTEATSSLLMRHMVSAVSHLHNFNVCHGELVPDCFVFTKKITKTSLLNDLSLKLVDVGRVGRFGTSASSSGGAGGSAGDAGAAEKPLGIVGGGPGLPLALRARASKSRIGCQAPEQVATKDDVPPKPEHDVWALGAMMFFLITGEWPALPVGADVVPLAPEAAWAAVSADSRTFEKLCLRRDAAERASTETLLAHPWLRLGQQAFEEAVALHLGAPRNKRSSLHAPLVSATSIIDGFKSLSAMSGLEKASINAVAHHLPEDKIQHLRAEFERLDKNGDGTLTIDEISAGLSSALEQAGLSPQQVQETLAAIDTDGNGSVDYTEFIAATFRHRENLKDDVCEAAFRVFDDDGSGTVTMEELKKALKGCEIGTGSIAAEAAALLETIDTDGNGEIDLQEFKEMLRGKKEPDGRKGSKRGTQANKAGNKTGSPTASTVDTPKADEDLDVLAADGDAGPAQVSAADAAAGNGPRTPSKNKISASIKKSITSVGGAMLARGTSKRSVSKPSPSKESSPSNERAQPPPSPLNEAGAGTPSAASAPSPLATPAAAPSDEPSMDDVLKAPDPMFMNFAGSSMPPASRQSSKELKKKALSERARSPSKGGCAPPGSRSKSKA